MKRCISFLVLLALIVPVLLLPASAAEQQEYVFEWVNPEVMLLGEDFVFEGEGVYFVCDTLIPDGQYNFYLSLYDAQDGLMEVCSLEPFFVSWSLYDGNLSSSCIVPCSLLYPDESFFFDVLFEFFSFGSSTVLYLSFDGDPFMLDGSGITCVLTPCKLVPPLTDYLSADSFAGVLDEIIALLPVVMVVVIGYVGTRKGLAWVRDQLYGA